MLVALVKTDIYCNVIHQSHKNAKHLLV